MSGLNFGEAEYPPTERVTGGIPVIDTNHAQVHAGNAFTVDVDLAGLGAGASKVVTITVPAWAYVHLQNIVAVADKALTVEFIESDGNDADGSAPVDPVNRHRISATPSVLEVDNHGTTGASSTTMKTIQAPAGRNAATGIVQDGIEWILKQTNTYTIKVTNKDGATSIGVGGVSIDWYEEGGA